MSNRVSSNTESDGKQVASSERAERDADMVELFAGFLAESAEGLEHVDRIRRSTSRRPDRGADRARDRASKLARVVLPTSSRFWESGSGATDEWHAPHSMVFEIRRARQSWRGVCTACGFIDADLAANIRSYEGIPILPEQAGGWQRFRASEQAFRTQDDGLWRALDGRDGKRAWALVHAPAVEAANAEVLTAVEAQLSADRGLLSKLGLESSALRASTTLGPAFGHGASFARRLASARRAFMQALCPNRRRPLLLSKASPSLFAVIWDVRRALRR